MGTISAGPSPRCSIGHVSAQISGVGPAAVARIHAKGDSSGSHRYNNFDTENDRQRYGYLKWLRTALFTTLGEGEAGEIES